MGKRNILAKEINYFGCASFWLSFFHFGWGKRQVTALLFNISVEAFCSILYPTYCFRHNLCCTFIVHSNHNFLPHQNIPHSSPFSAGTRARPRSPRTTERLSTALRVHITLLACYLPISLVSGLITTGLQTPTIFFLWAQTALIRLFTHSGLYTEFEDERYKTSSEGLFQKICILSN